MVARMVAERFGHRRLNTGHQDQMTPANDNARPFSVSLTANSRTELMHAISTVLRTLDAAPGAWTVSYGVGDDASPPSATLQRRAR